MSWLNEQIIKNPNLGSGYCIGHSFFCPSDGEEERYDDDWYQTIIRYEITP